MSAFETHFVDAITGDEQLQEQLAETLEQEFAQNVTTCALSLSGAGAPLAEAIQILSALDWVIEDGIIAKIHVWRTRAYDSIEGISVDENQAPLVEVGDEQTITWPNDTVDLLLKELERARASFRAHPTEANEVRLADANSKALTGLAQALDSFVAAAEPAQTALSTARASLLEGTARFKEESAGMVEEANRQQAITDEAHGRLYALAQRLAELGQLGTDGPLQSPDLARSVRNLRRIEITAQKLARAGQTEASNAEQDRRDVLNSVAYIEHAEGEELEKRFHAAIKIASADGAITNAPMSWRFRKYGYPRDDQDCREWLHKNDSEVLWLAREYVSAYRSWEFRMRRAMLEAGFDEGTAKHRYRELTDVFLNYSDHDVFEHYDGDVLKSWLQKYVEPMSKIADDVDTTPVVRVGCETVVKPGGGIEFNVNEEDMAKLFET